MRCVIFVVEGNTGFPLDMLRYDACHPVLQEDPGKLYPNYDCEQRNVTLAHYAPRKGWKPTHERWRSFGWTVKGIIRDEAVR